ncbi:hypothetical protein HPB52_001351 [Rhipicephalus sanguineus]|uniref:DDE Tnp4 domain-containing protein n=1 Tax=Rhipicephalus sanguineus TaxID=34632 RepID=A0A9D4QGI9_RHISA|nr:hypothetical protein HPB52_001351 [Rhipicephalus sanguineus]
MDSTTFKLMFRFQKHDFNDLCSALLVPREITTAQNVRLCGREALCVLLRRLAYPNRWCDLEGIFGRHSSVMSSATSRLMDHILSTFGHLLTDVNNHEWISPASLKEFAGLDGHYPGSWHDARIFRETVVYTKLERLTANEDFVVYGDPAYPLRPLLMKPYGGSHLSPAQQAFNCGMSAVREAV